MSVRTITEENFEQEVLKSKNIAIVDFYANWCGPCKMMAPIIEDIAQDETLTVGKVNVDENQELAIKFDIMSIPTILIFKDGELINRIVGLCDKSELLNSIK